MQHIPSLAFFQATSTIIPTLAIAFAVSSGILKVQEGKDARIWFLAEHKVRNIVIVALFIFGFATGEMISLASVATNHPTHLGMYVVMGGIILMLWLILYNAIAPMLDTMKAWQVAQWTAGGGFILLIVIFLASFFVLGGSIG